MSTKIEVLIKHEGNTYGAERVTASGYICDRCDLSDICNSDDAEIVGSVCDAMDSNEVFKKVEA